MDTFLTILIWFGSGFAFSVGIFIGACLMALAARDQKGCDDANSLLRLRNEIGERQVAALERIAAYLENRNL